MVLARVFRDLGSRIAEILTRRERQAARLYGQGKALLKASEPRAALDRLDRALRLEPRYAEALNERARALLDLGRLDDALASCQSALGINPDFAEAYYTQGNALLACSALQEALASYERALQLKPDFADAHYNSGLVLQRLKRPEDALAAYERALELKPDDAEALNNRGNVLVELKRLDLALASFERALSFKHDYVNARFNLGLALQEANRPEDAAQCFAGVLDLAPDYPFAKGKLLHAMMLSCDWSRLPELADSLEADVLAGKKAVEPFVHQGVSGSARAMKVCAETYSAENFPAAGTPLWAGERYSNQRIRVGYVSGELRQQATAILMTGLFESHDKSRFEMFAFDNGWDDGSDIRVRINRAFDEIVDITRRGDLETAAMIRDRKIDILVNLNGFFGRERQAVFSHKPAPIQINYLGFPGTLGVSYMDYILADRHVIPPEHEAFYAEKIVYLPDSYQANDAARRIAQRKFTRGDAGLPETAFVFCCFNNNYKITPTVFDVWMGLLKKVPGSVLWLLEDNPSASAHLRREAAQRDVEPQRLVFAARMKPDEHLARQTLADLFLDTLPSNAHTTASDALWAGLPILTCTGTAFPGRVAGSLLKAVGLPELIAPTLERYEALALELATTPAMLAGLRAKLAANRTAYPLFDTERFCRHVESAYVTMWQRYQRGEPPACFEVSPLS